MSWECGWFAKLKRTGSFSGVRGGDNTSSSKAPRFSSKLESSSIISRLLRAGYLGYLGQVVSGWGDTDRVCI